MARHYALDERPEAADITKLHTDLLTVWQDAHTKWEEVDTFVQGTNPLWGKTPGGANKPQYHTGMAAAILDHVVSLLAPYSPQVHRPPAGEGEGHERDANQVEKWLARVGQLAGSKTAQHPYKAMWRYLMQYGYAPYFGMALDYSYLRERPKRKRGEEQEDFEQREQIWETRYRHHCPFQYAAPHPATVLMDPGRAHPDVAIVQQVLYAYEVEDLVKRVGQRKSALVVPYDAGENPYEKVKCLSFWTPYWRAFMPQGGGELFYAMRNKWGFQPYGHGFSGKGGDIVDTEGSNPLYLAVGVLDNILGNLLAYDQQQTAKQNVLMQSAWRHRTYGGDPVEAARQLQDDSTILQKDKPDQWGWEPVLELSQSLFKMTDEVRRDIEFGSIPGDVAGIRQEGVTTVGQQSILMGQALKGIDTAILQMGQAATEILQNCLRLVGVLSDPKQYGEDALTVGEQTLRAEQLHGNYVVDARFSVVDPSIRQAEKEQAMAEFKLGVIGFPQLWQKLGYEDTTEIWRDVQKMKMEQQPEVAAELAATTMEMYGFKEMADEMRKRLVLERVRRQMATAPAATPPQGVPPTNGAMPSEQPQSPAEPRALGTAVSQMQQGQEAAMTTPEAVPYG